MAEAATRDSSLPTLALAHPTEKEKTAQFKQNGAAWRGALSLELYLRREEILASQNLTKDGGLTYWVLIDTAANDRLVLSGCETYRKKALVARNGKVEETITHGIGSVFCPPQLRRRGYTARMMQELGEALRTWQTEGKECLFSVLFSDIGKKFYAAHGWEPFNSSHISVPAKTSRIIDTKDLPTAQPLYEGDLGELCKIDEAMLRKSLEARPADSNTAVALIPNVDTIRWHHAREDYVGKELHGKAPKVKGAIVGSEKGKRVWCYWTRMWYNNDPKESKGNTLHVLRLVIEDEGLSSWKGSGGNHINGSGKSHQQNGDGRSSYHESAIVSLLLMAQREAQEWNMAEIGTWNPTSVMVSAAQRLDPNTAVVNRDEESIASLKWHPPHKGLVAESIDWVGNEKYGWC
ncbi:uncharacterized protein K441DRAFT_689403 [Cenococcum geophilum 1.58]|uniref:uncharacterized protein n=1 Tax=Cenococcum geophilum 1.58 TaxID=794803 RepID=UPI00358E78BF|nr:hypothetical protein K441DRAFT_689403 [Cenococcum geophilum 1.58]